MQSPSEKEQQPIDAAASPRQTSLPRGFLSRNIHQYPYLWVCFAMCVGVMGTALASPLYPLYQEAWHLSAGDVTLVYVVYMASALCGLLFLGKLSDQYGFMPVLRFSICLVTAGVSVSAIAWSFGSFSFSRVLIGIASSLIVTSASIGLSRLSRSGDLQRAAATTSLMLAFGFGLGPVIGGLIAQWAPAPLRTSYMPSMAMGLLSIYALFTLKLEAIGIDGGPTQHSTSSLKHWLPSVLIPRAPSRRPFLIASFSAFTAFGVFSLFASLAPTFMAAMLPWHGPAISGLSIGIILFLSALFQLLARPWPTRRCIILGLSSLGLSNLLLILNIYTNSIFVFAIGLIVTALGHGLCLLSGMAIVQKVAPPQQRAALTSTYLITGYLGAIAPILGVGWIADTFGLDIALISFCLSISALSFALAYMAQRTPAIIPLEPKPAIRTDSNPSR